MPKQEIFALQLNNILDGADCALRDCNINLKLNYKISIMLHNQKIYDSHLIF